MSPAPDSTLDDPQKIIADLQRANAELQRRLDERTDERDEALKQQTATAEVLHVINSSPGDLTPVFHAMLERARQLCEADIGTLWTFDGEAFSADVVSRSMSPSVAEMRTSYWPSPGTALARMMAGEDLVHILDVAANPAYQADPDAKARISAAGTRTTLAIALRKDERLLGAITTGRKTVRAYSAKQIALLQNFAAQAVIAMENARLITETREALEQQTATAEVLQVINSSPGDLAPVFDAILEKAHSLCGSAFGSLQLYEAGKVRAVAVRAIADDLAQLLRQPMEPLPGSRMSRLIAGERFVHTPDIVEVAKQFPNDPRLQLSATRGLRTGLFVPLRRNADLLGYISAFRDQVRPFSEKEIGLLENFAAQAVIAMENARLITETREALEQQTATAEVLQVINSSPGDLAPVFEAMLEKAMRLCEASFGIMFSIDGDSARIVAMREVPAALSDFLAQHPPGIGPDTIFGRAILERAVLHTPDVREGPQYHAGQPLAITAADRAGVRALLMAPLIKDDVVPGVFAIFRREVRPFSDKQIALLESFAAQAVIAIENARLITETREALDQQTATVEVLGVINSSPGDLAPVFDAMLEKAMRLCEASLGLLYRFDGEALYPLATRGASPEAAELLKQPVPIEPESAVGYLARSQDEVIHNPDITADEIYRARAPSRVTLVEVTGARTALWVALRKDGRLVGVFIIYRQEVRPFTDKQIALLQNFAAQAVIAMENARLITETREALEQQTATAEVLQVINASPGDLAPVFEAMLERAMWLCGAEFGMMSIKEDDRSHTVATRGVPAALAEFRRHNPAPPASPIWSRVLKGEPFIHTVDLKQEEAYESSDPHRRALVDLGGARTSLAVTLMKDRAVLGAIHIYRQEVRPFSEKQIVLLQNFAAQAVIAMENARLITETREALEQQTATAEILEVINRSPGNLLPVFDVLLDKALHLSESAFGALMLHQGDDRHRVVAMRGAPPARIEFWTKEPLYLGPGTAMYLQVRGERRPVHITDAAEDKVRSGNPYWRTMVDDDGIRTWLAVPLHKDSILLGTLIAFRREVRPFTDKQIAVLQSFAAQAVIAMENARLLDEIRQRQAELRVTFDNMADGVVMFDENLRLAAWNTNFQELLDLPDAVLAARPTYSDYLRLLAERGEFGTDDTEAELTRRLERTDQEFRVERTRPDGRVIEVRRNAVPDGGFVLIYSDITERKRSEEEIRAARDAAEAAYRDLKAAQASLVQAEKMASLGQLTAGIAHEIKNPLNFVNNFASLSTELLGELKEEVSPALATLDGDEREEIDETIEMLTGNLEKIVEHGQRADNIVKSMLEHSRGVTGERRAVDLNTLIDEALNLAYHGARAQDASFNITLERDFDPKLAPIELAPQEMTRVFLNLIGNGFYATKKRAHQNGDGSFKPLLSVATREVDDAVEVRVRDNGTGIPPEIKDKLFQPFFTTKPTGEGTGLGLSISYDIITQQHAGTITVDSEPGEFTEFTVRLPRH